MKTGPLVSALKRKAREIVVKTLYEVEMGGLSRQDAEERIRRKCTRPETREFALRILSVTLEHVESADRIIGQVAKNWDLSRMAAFDRNLLRLGTVEIILFDDVPDKVTINEAIEIAKKFSTENSGRFVNGILDQVARIKSDLRGNF
jgi:transcription antitermination factor NusB